MHAVTLRTLGRLFSISALAVLFSLGAGCAGDDGDAGANGGTGGTGAPGQPGTPGSAGTIAASQAERLDITITGVAIASGKATINFKVVDPYNRGVTGIRPLDSRFSMARLAPGTGGKSSEWRSYYAVTANPAAGARCPTSVDPAATGPCPGTTPQKQASAEQAATATGPVGVWVESANGVYSYTFQKALTDYDGVAYDATLTHRAGVEIRNPNPLYNANNPLNNVRRYTLSNNPTYDFQPSTGAVANIAQRNIVNNAECNACHDRLSIHGEGRFDIPYCMVCHNPYTKDAESAFTVDMKVMIHKIHRGDELPSVSNQNKPYYIYGFGGPIDFSEVTFPQDVRNCQTCHRETDPSTPQASNWRKTVNSDTCSSCHDDINFQTGVGHPAALDSDCATCHGENATYDGGKWKVENVHFDPFNREAENFKYEIVKVEAVKADGSPGATACAASTKACTVLPGEYPKVTIKISNPKTGALYKLTDAPFTNIRPPTTRARARVRLAYTTQNFTNKDTPSSTTVPNANDYGRCQSNLSGSSSASNYPAQPVCIDFLPATLTSSITSGFAYAPPVPGRPGNANGAPTLNADGTYTKIAAAPVPAGLVGNGGAVVLEGRTIMPIKEKPSDPAPIMEEIPVVASTAVYFPSSGTTAVARRSIINVNKCNDCHKNISGHGSNRNSNEELCATCHNPELSGFNHTTTANAALTPAQQLEEGLSESFDSKWMFHRLHTGDNPWTSEFAYPGKLNNCEGCHLAPTGTNPSYYPPNPALVFGTSYSKGASVVTPDDDLAVSPTVAVCLGCHETSTAEAHMEQNGGSLRADKTASGELNTSEVETCQLCHGPGRSADVKEVHDVGGFRYN